MIPPVGGWQDPFGTTTAVGRRGDDLAVRLGYRPPASAGESEKPERGVGPDLALRGRPLPDVVADPQSHGYPMLLRYALVPAWHDTRLPASILPPAAMGVGANRAADPAPTIPASLDRPDGSGHGGRSHRG